MPDRISARDPPGRPGRRASALASPVAGTRKHRFPVPRRTALEAPDRDDGVVPKLWYSAGAGSEAGR